LSKSEYHTHGRVKYGLPLHIGDRRQAQGERNTLMTAGTY
jgi:hypothetical protein